MAKANGTMDRFIEYIAQTPGESVTIKKVMAALDLDPRQAKNVLFNARNNPHIDIDIGYKEQPRKTFHSVKFIADRREEAKLERERKKKAVEKRAGRPKGLLKTPWLYKWVA